MFITRAISFTNFFVATSALGFQVCVLYPWHKQLDDGFETLKTEHRRVLNTIRDGDAAEKPEGKELGLRARVGNLVGWTL